MRSLSCLRFILGCLLLQLNILWAQTAFQFAPINEISDQSLNTLVGNAIVMAFDLSPDGRLITILAIAGPKVEAPQWLVTVDTSTKRIVASRELGLSVWPKSVNFRHQVLYSSDQRYLVVQDLRQISVLDARSLESLRTITIPVGAGRLVPLSIVGASNSDVFVCAFGSENQPRYGLLATPAQIEVIDISSGKILGEWASEDVPQSASPNGELIAVSAWQRPNQRRVVPLAVFDRNGRKVADLNDRFSFKKNADQPKPLGRVIGRFVSNQEILLSPDDNIDETGHSSGDSIKLVSVTASQAEQKVAPQHFAPHGDVAVSADGKTILVGSFYIKPRFLAKRHGVLPQGEGKLFVLGLEPTLHVNSVVPIDSSHEYSRVSLDGSVIAARHYRRGITVLMKNPRR